MVCTSAHSHAHILAHVVKRSQCSNERCDMIMDIHLTIAQTEQTPRYIQACTSACTLARAPAHTHLVPFATIFTRPFQHIQIPHQCSSVASTLIPFASIGARPLQYFKMPSFGDPIDILTSSCPSRAALCDTRVFTLYIHARVHMLSRMLA